MTWTASGDSVDRPTNRPAAADDRTTVVAPDWLRSRWFSASRTLTEMGTLALSSRTVSVTSVAVSSRLHVMMTAWAVWTRACSHTAACVASAPMATNPASRARVTASASTSMTTICPGRVVPASNVSTALCPTVPKPATMM